MVSRTKSGSPEIDDRELKGKLGAKSGDNMLVSCPFCKQRVLGKKTLAAFLLRRCKMIDLGKWAMEDYKIPGENVDHSSTEEEKEEVDRREK